MKIYSAYLMILLYITQVSYPMETVGRIASGVAFTGCSAMLAATAKFPLKHCLETLHVSWRYMEHDNSLLSISAQRYGSAITNLGTAAILGLSCLSAYMGYSVLGSYSQSQAIVNAARLGGGVALSLIGLHSLTSAACFLRYLRPFSPTWCDTIGSATFATQAGVVAAGCLYGGGKLIGQIFKNH